MTISHKIINEQFFMSFPYELKDTFRTLFKTAKWNPAHTASLAANTPQNHKKWERFVQAADTASRLLAQKDHEAVTAKERLAEHTSKLQSLMRISYAVICLKKKLNKTNTTNKKTKET